MTKPFTRAFRKKLYIGMVAVAASFYVLEGILINPFIVWTVLPLYVALGLYSRSEKSNEISKLPAILGFLIFSLLPSYAYHIAWFFDIDGTQSSSSTSALIFVFFPIYCVLMGYVGYFAGIIYSWFRSK